MSRDGRHRCAAAVLIALLCCRPLTAQGSSSLTVGQPAPVVTVPDLDGKPVRIALGAGKQAAVVEFWATWCELCRALLPEMRRARKAFGDRVDFFGVNVTVNDSRARVERYVNEVRPPFVTVYDARGVAVRAFWALATSHVVIVDRHGRVAYVGDGADQKITAELAGLAGR